MRIHQLTETEYDRSAATKAHHDARKSRQEKEKTDKYSKSLAGQYSLPCQPRDSFVVDARGNPIVKCINLENATEMSVALNQYISKTKQISEAPIAATDNPNDPMIYGHQKANSMTLQGRISQARAQLKELAELADRNDLLAWEEICKKAKGGMFMGLEQNLEQIRHGIEELSKKRAKGGIQSRGIDKNIG